MTNNKNLANFYSSEIYAKTKKYQKLYGFCIGKGEHDTHNNEADAFKHTFASADMALKATAGISKVLGNKHEDDGRIKMGQSADEENMDKWNNSEGRKIAQKIEKQINNPVLLKLYASSGKLDDLIAKEVMQKMHAGKLITNPSDKRKYTGFAADINKEKTFTREEIGKMSTKEFQKNEKMIMKQLREKGIPTKLQLEEMEKVKASKNSNSSKADSSGEGRWVTINGNHVLLEN